MRIQIGKVLIVTKDDRCLKVSKLRYTADGQPLIINHTGEQSEKLVGYYGTLEEALVALLEYNILTAEVISLAEVIHLIQDIKSEIKKVFRGISFDAIVTDMGVGTPAPQAPQADFNDLIG